jgi:hypothetical protein
MNLVGAAAQTEGLYMATPFQARFTTSIVLFVDLRFGLSRTKPNLRRNKWYTI